MTVRCGSVRQLPAKPTRSQVFSVIRTLAINASAVMPPNITIAVMPIAARVRAAFSLLGGLNAGTPLEIASTPVSAVQPEANARSARMVSARPVSPIRSGRTCQCADSASGAWPSTASPRPTAIMTMMPAMNAYVGTANARPDSFTPRRFIAISTATKKMLMPTRYALNWGTAEMMLSTPAATETATVMM
jgi:hypothetical protein